MFKRKTETIKFNDFMDRSYKESENFALNFNQVERLAWIPVIGLTLTIANRLRSTETAQFEAFEVFSNVGEAVPAGALTNEITSQVIHAFDPLVNLMISLSLPIASVILTGAALMIMINQKERGYAMMMQASIGYVLVQLTPLFIKLLAGIGAAI